jgi:hypothetical protein
LGDSGLCTCFLAKGYVLILTKMYLAKKWAIFSKLILPFLTSPLAPMCEIGPLGGMFTPSFTPKAEHSVLFRRMEGQTENFTPRG